MDKKSYFIVSGIISFSFYILICFLFIYYITSPKVKTYNVKAKTTTIELDMIVEKSDKKRVQKKEDKKIEKPIEKVIEKSTSASNEKRPDVKSLFGKVKTKEKKVPKKVVTNIEKSLDPKRFKSKFEKQKKSSNVKIDKLLNDKKTTTTTKNKSVSKNNESNEYFSKVHTLLDEFIPTTREENLKAVVLVIISPSGKFDYRFDKYSGNSSFDISLKAFLEEQKSIMYPKPKKGKTININVDFKSEG